uniref:Mixed-linked glucanase n=1 Tax=Ganoderma boninense TaxID=34458 RepID=A0A5K1K6Q7_9APHY|nr:Mixed-linked glucanase [Ganoderma boninense]
MAAFPQTPRKVPLALGDEHIPRPKPRSNGSTVTKRVFFCGVVVEGTEGGRELPQDVQDLIASLGESVDMVPEAIQPSPSQANEDAQAATRRRAMTNSSAFTDLVKELIATERNYVKKMGILKTEYADPLRSYSKDKHTAIIGPYEAKTLFGNIDQLLPVNEAFLADLEKMDPTGNGKPGVGDVALKHFKKLKGFEKYGTYFAKHEEVQRLMETEQKKNSRFAEYIERVRYSTAFDSRNKFGLTQLIAEPWQRIPRYTLLFNTMLKHMAMNHPQRAPLEEAIQYATVIAKAETDAETKRMAIMHCLSTSIEDFPVSLISNSRQFIDCIDVQDVLGPDPHTPISSNSPASAGTLHCSLFLFDDKVMIVKRPAEKSGRTLAGLDPPHFDKVVKGGTLPSSMRKNGLVCKGLVDITEVNATDIGGPDFHIFLENALLDQSERWGGRQFRALSVVFPPVSVGLDPIRTDREKHRFLNHLWAAQARVRTRMERSIILKGEECEVENRGGYVTKAQTYFNVYTRMNFLQEPKKTKIVMHIDQDGVADPIPFGDVDGPYVVVRVQPMAGELARYSVTSTYEEETEEDIMQTSRIPERIVQTIHQYGLFKFKTNATSSRPTTPTASRSRAAIFGLDVISRNLFGSRSAAASMTDFFAGSVGSHRRSRTADSRSSTLTGTASTAGSSSTRFSRSSTTTSSTSIMDDEPPPSSMSKGSRSSRSRSLSKGAKKLVKRAKSPFMSEREDTDTDDDDSPRRSHHGRTRSYGQDSFKRSKSLPRGSVPSMSDIPADDSERALAMRLELARRNSKNQHGHDYSAPTMEEPSEETIYEGRREPFQEPPQDYDYESQRSATPSTFRAHSPAPSTIEPYSRSLSRNSSNQSDRRPMGPRSPSPLPSPRVAPTQLPSLDNDTDMTLVQAGFPTTPTHRVYPRTPIPRSKRQPFEPTSVLNTDTTPKATAEKHATGGEPAKPPSIIEPLSIKKRSSVRTESSVVTLSPGKGSPARRTSLTLTRRPSPIGKAAFANTGTRRVSGQRTTKALSGGADVDLDEVEAKVTRAAEATKADIESSHRAIKRIKLETQKVISSSPVRAAVATWETKPTISPIKRTPQRTPVLQTKEAEARRAEMLSAIGKRNGDSGGPPRPRVQTMFEPSTSSASIMSNGGGSPRSAVPDDSMRTIDNLAEEADQELEQALRNQESVTSEMRVLVQLLHQEVNELYQYFNEELDGMFDAASLPDDDAWAAMTKKMKEAQQGKAKAEHENSQLKTRIAELELQHGQ